MCLAIKGLNHFLFSVSDLERSVAFYRDALGARLLVKGRSI
nr:VOC family protein [Bacillus sp. FJAT-27445]